MLNTNSVAHAEVYEQSGYTIIITIVHWPNCRCLYWTHLGGSAVL